MEYQLGREIVLFDVRGGEVRLLKSDGFIGWIFLCMPPGTVIIIDFSILQEVLVMQLT